VFLKEFVVGFVLGPLGHNRGRSHAVMKIKVSFILTLLEFP